MGIDHLVWSLRFILQHFINFAGYLHSQGIGIEMFEFGWNIACIGIYMCETVCTAMDWVYCVEFYASLHVPPLTNSNHYVNYQLTLINSPSLETTFSIYMPFNALYFHSI